MKIVEKALPAFPTLKTTLTSSIPDLKQKTLKTKKHSQRLNTMYQITDVFTKNDLRTKFSEVNY